MRADLPDIGNPDQDPMSEVGYPTGVVGFHGLFGCKPLGPNHPAEKFTAPGSQARPPFFLTIFFLLIRQFGAVFFFVHFSLIDRLRISEMQIVAWFRDA